jgi:hypothetical protein
MPADPLALLRSRSYVALLVLAAIIGAPISAVAYFFLALVDKLNGWIFTSLPHGLGFASEPLWWPVPPLVLAGILVALTLRAASAVVPPFRPSSSARWVAWPCRICPGSRWCTASPWAWAR